HVLPIATPEGLAQVPVEGVSGGRLRLGGVATIRDDHQPLIGDAVVAGGPGLLLAVEKLPGANTLQVTRDVEKALKELQPGLAGGVDDAVVGVERSRRRLRADVGDSREQATASAVLEASVETNRPMIYAVCILLLAIMPVFFVGGLYGSLYQPLVVSYALAVLA